ncbi:MAG TPA: dTDP-4-dehydrorhamnose 3,5-epimerase [Candidatus Methylacidiphilales bacterium]|jgi:dTDP-4-dehydrorhamnose 3,5-epimerase|nr:dTDP-4-dehydrorhamnose 3,5-epimerase [Candidatus Methylacidiphilales bacterium]
MKIHSEILPGVFVLAPAVFGDLRGNFVKTYHKPEFSQLGIDYEVAEEFYSTSAKNVIRGMHFQTPPHDAVKLIYCIHGSVLDVLVDLRQSSPTFGQFRSIELSHKNSLIVMIPSGFGHGFLALENDTVMVYKASFVYAPDHDTGIRWDSFGFDWGVKDPIVSARDRALPSFAGWRSPFA